MMIQDMFLYMNFTLLLTCIRHAFDSCLSLMIDMHRRTHGAINKTEWNRRNQNRRKIMLRHLSFINERMGRTRVKEREKREIKLFTNKRKRKGVLGDYCIEHTAVSAQGVLEWQSSICAVSGGLPILFFSPGRRPPELWWQLCL